MRPELSTAAVGARLPRRFGRYTLFDSIGKGGMAEIYLARANTDLGGSRLCVVKQILPELAARPEFAEMLTFEAKLAARLNHANVVQVFDLGREGGQLFIAMDYVEGFDLNALLRRCSRERIPLPPEYAFLIVAETLKGLDYAHRRMDEAGKPLGIVHRDVSPSNILISFEGEVKVCDFGIAHANEVAHASGHAGGTPKDVDEAIKGKAGYMSPEHARGEVLDARADVFAAGIVLWELVAGRRMYRTDAGGPSLLDVARRAEVPPLPSRGLPNEAELERIVSKALATNRDERYPSAVAFLRDLEGYVRGARLVASPLRLGEWLVTNLGTDTVVQRRARERAAHALERGPLTEVVPLVTSERLPLHVDTPSDANVAALVEPDGALESGAPSASTMRVRARSSYPPDFGALDGRAAIARPSPRPPPSAPQGSSAASAPSAASSSPPPRPASIPPRASSPGPLEHSPTAVRPAALATAAAVVPAADASSSVETVASFRRGRVHWVTWLVLLVVIGAALAVALVRGG